MTTRMTMSRAALLVALSLSSPSGMLGQSTKLRAGRRELQSTISSRFDGRWKSTKLTQKQKAAMGLYPPPGEQWPDDPPGLADEQGVEPTEGEGGETEGEGEDGPPPEGGGAEEQKPEGEGEGLEPPEEEGTIAVVDTAEEEEAEVEELKEATAPPEEAENDSMEEGGQEGREEPRPKEYRRGTFLRYESSKWENGWADNIDQLVQRTSICKTLMHGKHQKANTHTLMELMCQARLEGELSNWCYYHDHNHYMWYNTANQDTFEVYVDTTPLILDSVDPPRLEAVDYSNERFAEVASKMVFKDNDTGEEYIEYIEPLVGQLKFPLTECLESKPLLADFASFVLPPPGIAPGRRTLMYDVGSSDWSRLEYIVEEWKVRGAEFEYIVSYAMNGDEVDDAFLTTIPEQHRTKVLRNYFKLVDDQNKVTQPNMVHVPVQIRQEAQQGDYVLVKLDRAPASLKEAYVKYILNNNIHVDELIWEINASGNYVMQKWMDTNLQFDEISSMTLEEAYGMLLQLRKRGIRAHSWI